ncbi:MAG: SnoaL-like domain protein [Bacteroidetes bacterium]|nr:SnoaL-like domain protein [Bacteroidota bacterium]
MKKISVLMVVLVLPSATLFSQTPSDSVLARFKNIDAEFSKFSAAKGPLEAFLAYLVDDAYLMQPDQVVLSGQNAVFAQYGSFPKGGSLTWDPDVADCSSAGDLGFTTGKYWSKRTVNNIPRTLEGTYMTVWKKQADGSLKVIADLGSPSSMAGEQTGVTVRRSPFKSEVSAAGDFGVTLGTFEVKSKDADGKEKFEYGKYVWVWRKGPDGKKEIVTDMSNASPAPIKK